MGGHAPCADGPRGQDLLDRCHTGRDARRDDHRAADLAGRPRAHDRLPREPNRELLGRRPRRDAGDPRAAALLVAGVEHLSCDRDGSRRRGRAGRARGIPVPAPLLPRPPPHPHGRDHRRDPAGRRARTAAPPLDRRERGRAVPVVHRPELHRRPRTQRHLLLGRRRARADRRPDHPPRPRCVLPVHVDRGRATRVGRGRRPRVTAGRARPPTAERRVGTGRAPRLRRDVHEDRHRRTVARPRARPHAAARRARRGGDRTHGALAHDHVVRDRARDRLAGRALPLLRRRRTARS